MARAFVGSYGTTSHPTKYGLVSTGGSNVGFHPIVIAGSIPVQVTRGVLVTVTGQPHKLID